MALNVRVYVCRGHILIWIRGRAAHAATVKRFLLPRRPQVRFIIELLHHPINAIIRVNTTILCRWHYDITNTHFLLARSNSWLDKVAIWIAPRIKQSNSDETVVVMHTSSFSMLVLCRPQNLLNLCFLFFKMLHTNPHQPIHYFRP
jgi:hypothetical protein